MIYFTSDYGSAAAAAQKSLRGTARDVPRYLFSTDRGWLVSTSHWSLDCKQTRLCRPASHFDDDY